MMGGSVNAQCTSWGVSAVADSSTCAANGRITLSFTGTGSENVSNMLYNLEPVAEGGFAIPPNTSSVFENVPAGNYRAVAKGTCNGNVVSATVDVTVPGNYVPFTAAVTQQKITLHNCNTGEAFVTVANGKLPFSVTILSAPARYTGPRSFVVYRNFTLDALWGGDYTLSITDACAATASVQTVSITELPQISDNDIAFIPPSIVAGTCNKILFNPPAMNGKSPYGPYFSGNKALKYSVSYDGVTRMPYRSLGSAAIDTFTLPEGQSYKDIYRKTVTYYFQTPCDGEVAIPYTITDPVVSTYTVPNCSRSFNAGFTLGSNNCICYPVYVSLEDSKTGEMRYDTVYYGEFQSEFKELPFGRYILSVTSADGALLRQDAGIWGYPPPANPYEIATSPFMGKTGNDGAVYFFINRIGGALTVGTTINLISPSQYTYSRTVTQNSLFWMATMTTDIPMRYFYPGNYLFRITDECGTYDVPVNVTEEDVYRYNWGFTTEQTCTGLLLMPTGTASYNGTTVPTYYKILRGPLGTDIGYDKAIVPEGDTLVLPMEGTYKIGVSADPMIVSPYDDSNGGGNAVNVKTIDFKYQPLIMDVNKSVGWVCPGQPDNSGSIAAFALGGSKVKTGVYTYKLAEQGKGGTGPYWAANTTGRFSTATSGGAYTLVKDQNYDIRVEDECGGAAVQTLKIIDLETAQLASSDKQTYCVGDRIEFKIINLPATAITYTWTGPDGFTSNLQNPVLSPVTSSSGGNYHVVVNSDICMQPIQADVLIKVADYITTCYSAVTDTSVNPYAYSLLGNWRAQKTYVYNAVRTESSTAQATNIRTDGTIKSFKAFWQRTGAVWKPQYDESRWTWSSESTIFNKKGLEIENKDPLGRFNAGIYGFDNSLVLATVQNSRYRESVYEGFEDYFFGGTSCEDGCPVARSFDFSAYKNNLDSLESHTGKYSLRIAAGKSAGVTADVVPDKGNIFSLSFNKEDNNCVAGQVLGGVRANQDALLPVFSPLVSKRILVSAWVKEDRPCSGATYTGNRMNISVKRAATATVLIAYPKGPVIDGWQRYEQFIDLPADATGLVISMEATGTSTVYFDDLRIHPYNANMRSFVYNPSDLRMMAELDENNYATFYEYDDDGTLIRVKAETENGIKMISEIRNALIKE
jgi:hypothetical protein